MQLTSIASKTEFPSNTSHSFKNRLPHPLQFREPGWKVGMSSISLPEAPQKMKLNEAFLFCFSWIKLWDAQLNIYTDEMPDVRERDQDFVPRTRTEFMNWVRDRYLWALRDQALSDLQLFKKKTRDDDPTELLHMVINPVMNGDCVIDNTTTCTSIQINSGLRYPKLTVGLELAKKMQWIVMRKDFLKDVVPRPST